MVALEYGTRSVQSLVSKPSTRPWQSRLKSFACAFPPRRRVNVRRLRLGRKSLLPTHHPILLQSFDFDYGASLWGAGDGSAEPRSRVSSLWFLFVALGQRRLPTHPRIVFYPPVRERASERPCRTALLSLWGTVCPPGVNRPRSPLYAIWIWARLTYHRDSLI